MGDRDNLFILPDGWAWTKLAICSELITKGESPKWQGFNYVEQGIIFIRSENVLWGKLDLSNSVKIPNEFHQKLKRSQIIANDVLINLVGASIGRCGIVSLNLESANINQAVALIRVNDPLTPTYLMHLLLSPFIQKNLHTSKVETARPNISLGDLNHLDIPLPPLAEQNRIVAKIEELFTQLDAGVELLKKLKAKLKRYRQAVLKAAVEGKLTKDWREAYQGELEPASVLLERILKERREKWEAEQLAQMKAKGKSPKDDSWKLKYKEPVAPDTSDLFELPEGWEWISLDYVLSKIEAGKSFKCEERTPTVEEVGVVKVSAVTWGEFNEFESKTCVDLDRINPQLFVKEGNFLFSRANTIELVGACVIAKQVTRRVMLSDKILRFSFVELPSKWILFALRTRLGRNEIEQLSTGNQESMRNIGQERIRRIRISLPPVQEIQQIVSELERRFSVTDELEKVLNQNLKRAEKLRQSILKKAFEGKLVPQDPIDEPADKLLERIKAEKAKRETETKAKKKQKQPGKSQQLELF
jgi:type I restriction enzyme S subunit